MSPDDHQRIRQVADRLRALADETRIRLLLLLRQEAQPVGALARLAGLPQPTVSKHLARLKAVGLVQARRQGAEVVYAVRDPDLDALCGLLCQGVERFIAADYAR